MTTLRSRSALDYLTRWRRKFTRKPLLLRGARQVGKSSLVRLHAQDYAAFVELNLELPADRALFEGLPPVDDLLARIALRARRPTLDADCLLFIDEIQESPEAIQQLRYLYETRPGLPVIAAGSLLEFALGDVVSFPVGRVEYYTLHPLNFEEYLRWTGRDQLADCLAFAPAPTYAHEELLAAFHRYAVVGGMPEPVAALADGAELPELTAVYESIWSAYRADAEKYARSPRERAVLRHLMATAAAQDDRVKLAGFGGSEYRSDDVGSAFRALELAGVLRLIYPTTSLAMPIVPALRKRPRVQLLDTGLLNHARGIQADLLHVGDLTAVYRGRIAQHIVTQEIIATHHEPSYSPHFWVREQAGSSAEVDLVLPSRGQLYPLEVKAGPQGKLRSLHQFVQRTGVRLGLRALRNAYSETEVTTPTGTEYKLVNIPYYAVGSWERFV